MSVSTHPSARTPRTPVSEIDDKIRDLRMRGMSCSGIAIALDVFCGWRLTHGQVRYRCLQMSWPRGGVPDVRAGRKAAT